MPGSDGEVRRGCQAVEDSFYSPKQGILNSSSVPVAVQSFLAGTLQPYKAKGQICGSGPFL